MSDSNAELHANDTPDEVSPSEERDAARPEWFRPEQHMTHDEAFDDEPARPADEPSLAGTMLGEFRLVRPLGRGGMADVWLAEQTTLDRQVAVKLLRKGLLAESGEVALSRFEQEAKAAGLLTHPNIVQVYVVGAERGRNYIAQEYVPGGSLGEYVQRKGPLPVSLALHVMKQVAAALQAAGEAGIIHRDIKPENILLTKKGEAKVADFGLARLSLGRDQVRLTQAGKTLGTPLYMSPEQVTGGEIDARTDIYSFGVTCYAMLAGQPPFQGESAVAVAFQHANEKPRPLRAWRPDLPLGLCRIVERMMAKAPADRYPDAAALLKDVRALGKALRELPDDAEAADVDLTNEPGLSKDTGFQGTPSRPAAWFVLSCLLTAAASAGLGWWMRPPNPLAVPAGTTAVDGSDASVPKKQTPAAQLFYALEHPDQEAAWKAVEANFPNGPREKELARRQLACLYLRSGRLDEAEPLFRTFADRGDDAPKQKAFGVAGLAALASYRGEHAQSHRMITVEVYPLRESLGPMMRDEVREAIARNRRHLGSQVKPDLEDAFRSSNRPPFGR